MVYGCRSSTQRRMAKPELDREILVSVDEWERRVVLTEDGKPVECFFERRGRPSYVGNVYVGKVRDVVKGMSSTFVDIGVGRNAFLAARETITNGDPLSAEESQELRPRQSVLVQVVREPRREKGSRVSCHITVPGRYVVLLPFSDNVGISRRIEDDEERDRLKGIGEAICPPGFGLVLRTAVRYAQQEEVEADLQRTMTVWRDILRRSRRSDAPALLYREPELPIRIVRDLFAREFRMLTVDNEQVYTRILTYLQEVDPDLKGKVRLYAGRRPLFEKAGIEADLEQLFSREVWLRSGGYLVFDRTEALTAIDVNTGKYTGGRNLEETVFHTNLEAAEEVMRQLRLRDISGIIVVDFIDMAAEEQREAVVEALGAGIDRDRSRVTLVGITPIGLVEMTRKSVSGDSIESLKETCPGCSGAGYVLGEETIVVGVLRRVKSKCLRVREDAVLVKVHPIVIAVADTMFDRVTEQLEEVTGVHVKLIEDPEIPMNEFQIVITGTREDIERFSGMTG